MQVTADRRPEFTPPPEPGLLRSVALAVGAHAALVAALSWGIAWQRQDDNAVVEAELWSATVQQAAPKPVEPPPAPPPAPAVQPPPAPLQREADIALERERERKAAEDKKREDAERQRKLEAERRQQEQDKRELARKEAEAKKREEQARAAERKKQDEAALEKMRKENLERIAGLAGATGSRESTGTAQRSSAPSASYAGRLAAIFKRNVVFPGGVETISGNPAAEVQVSVSPTGDILRATLSRSSGNSAWDQAAVRAIERAEKIPPDENGRYVSNFVVTMRPKD